MRSSPLEARHLLCRPQPASAPRTGSRCGCALRMPSAQQSVRSMSRGRSLDRHLRRNSRVSGEAIEHALVILPHTLVMLVKMAAEVAVMVQPPESSAGEEKIVGSPDAEGFQLRDGRSTVSRIVACVSACFVLREVFA